MQETLYTVGMVDYLLTALEVDTGWQGSWRRGACHATGTHQAVHHSAKDALRYAKLHLTIHHVERHEP